MKAVPEEAVIEQLEDGTKDGAPAVTIAVRLTDGRIEQASMRPDLIPAGLAVGDRVTLTRAALYNRWTITRDAGS